MYHFNAKMTFAPLQSVTTLAIPTPIKGIVCPKKPKSPKISERPNGVYEIKEYGRVDEHVLEIARFEA